MSADNLLQIRERRMRGVVAEGVALGAYSVNPLPVIESGEPVFCPDPYNTNMLTPSQAGNIPIINTLHNRATPNKIILPVEPIQIPTSYYVTSTHKIPSTNISTANSSMSQRLITSQYSHIRNSSTEVRAALSPITLPSSPTTNIPPQPIVIHSTVKPIVETVTLPPKETHIHRATSILTPSAPPQRQPSPRQLSPRQPTPRQPSPRPLPPTLKVSTPPRPISSIQNFTQAPPAQITTTGPPKATLTTTTTTMTLPRGPPSVQANTTAPLPLTTPTPVSVTTFTHTPSPHPLPPPRDYEGEYRLKIEGIKRDIEMEVEEQVKNMIAKDRDMHARWEEERKRRFMHLEVDGKRDKGNMIARCKIEGQGLVQAQVSKPALRLEREFRVPFIRVGTHGNQSLANLNKQYAEVGDNSINPYLTQALNTLRRVSEQHIPTSDQAITQQVHDYQSHDHHRSSLFRNKPHKCHKDSSQTNQPNAPELEIADKPAPRHQTKPSVKPKDRLSNLDSTVDQTHQSRISQEPLPEPKPAYNFSLETQEALNQFVNFKTKPLDLQPSPLPPSQPRPRPDSLPRPQSLHSDEPSQKQPSTTHPQQNQVKTKVENNPDSFVFADCIDRERYYTQKVICLDFRKPSNKKDVHPQAREPAMTISGLTHAFDPRGDMMETNQLRNTVNLPQTQQQSSHQLTTVFDSRYTRVSNNDQRSTHLAHQNSRDFEDLQVSPIAANQRISENQVRENFVRNSRPYNTEDTSINPEATISFVQPKSQPMLQETTSRISSKDPRIVSTPEQLASSKNLFNKSKVDNTASTATALKKTASLNRALFNSSIDNPSTSFHQNLFGRTSGSSVNNTAFKVGNSNDKNSHIFTQENFRASMAEENRREGARNDRENVNIIYYDEKDRSVPEDQRISEESNEELRNIKVGGVFEEHHEEEHPNRIVTDSSYRMEQRVTFDQNQPSQHRQSLHRNNSSSSSATQSNKKPMYISIAPKRGSLTNPAHSHATIPYRTASRPNLVPQPHHPAVPSLRTPTTTNLFSRRPVPPTSTSDVQILSAEVDYSQYRPRRIAADPGHNAVSGVVSTNLGHVYAVFAQRR